MPKFIFIFGSTISERRFDTTYEAMCDYLDANNQYEDVFHAKDEKGNPVILTEAESLVKSISPVREYLEVAALAGFNDKQILHDTKGIHGTENATVPTSWKQYMKEYAEYCDRHITNKKKAASAYACIALALNGHECTFNEKKDDDFLAQFGIRRITGLRDSRDTSHKDATAIDRLLESKGLTGMVNDSALQDFVVEKDGVQTLVFVHWGIWAVGNDYAVIEN